MAALLVSAEELKRILLRKARIESKTQVCALLRPPAR
jgi:hypothetical protein